MLILPVEEVKVGMTLAAPVTHPDQPDQDLLKSGYILEETVLKRLQQIGVAFVYVDFPGLDELDRHITVNLSPARQKLYAQIKETITCNQQRTRPGVSYTDYYATTRELILTLMCQGQHPVYLEHISRLGTDAIGHAAAVAHLGLLLGIKLETYLIAQRHRLPAHHAKEVVNIGVAGMLHDMGKLTLPSGLQKFTGVDLPDDSAEYDQWQQHSRQGYDLIRDGVEPSAAAAVLHHHQHWDGSGFPAIAHRDGLPVRPAQTRIHIFARIVAVADLFDRLATRLDSTLRRSNLEVLHLMRTKYAPWCDPVVLRTLQAITPPFPPGSIVRLSDQTSAVVVDVDQNDPYRPIVKRVVGPDLQLDQTRLDLQTADAPSITHLGKTAVEPFLPKRDRQTIAVAATV